MRDSMVVRRSVVTERNERDNRRRNLEHFSLGKGGGGGVPNMH